nr:unnamed protein product [Spirometra erinaceieuropaei]
MLEARHLHSNPDSQMDNSRSGQQHEQQPSSPLPPPTLQAAMERSCGTEDSLFARKLTRCKVDIAALREARFWEGRLEEMGVGCIFSWSDRPKIELRDAAVAFAILGRLPSMMQGINDRLMGLRPLLQGVKYATIISAHAPTNDQL